MGHTTTAQRQRVLHLDACREALPRVVRLSPSASALERPLCTVVDVFEVAVHDLHALVKTRLVEAIQVGKVDLQPL